MTNLVTKVYSNNIIYGYLNELARKLVKEDEIPIIYYRQFGKNLTNGKAIIAKEEDIVDVLKSRDKDMIIDLYVEAFPNFFKRDPNNLHMRINNTSSGHVPSLFPEVDPRMKTPTKKKPTLVTHTRKSPRKYLSTYSLKLPTPNLPSYPSSLNKTGSRSASLNESETSKTVSPTRKSPRKHASFYSLSSLNETGVEPSTIKGKKKVIYGKKAAKKQDKLVPRRKSSTVGEASEPRRVKKNKKAEDLEKDTRRGRNKKGKDKVIECGNHWEAYFEEMTDKESDEEALDVEFSLGEEDLRAEELFVQTEEGSLISKVDKSVSRFVRGFQVLDPTLQEENSDDGEDELESLKGSDDEGDTSPVFNPEVDFSRNVVLVRGLKFPDKLYLKKALVHHAIQNRYDFYFEHNGNKRITTYCRNKCECEWNNKTSKFGECVCKAKRKCSYTIYAIPMGNDGVWQIRKLDLKHHCVWRGVNRKVNAEFLAEKYLEDWRLNLFWKLSIWQKQIKRDLGVDVKYGLCWLARARAKLIIYGDCADQYKRVWDYVAVVIKHIQGSTAIVVVDGIERPPPFFKRMYICLKQVKEGYINGCRPIIGVDGCHLKGPYSGLCLVAVGIDCNNIYPVAWAVVETENGESWSWFLRLY
ncbi:uncharacterized protein LOC141646207 [Silene latifolia]|uniref:uncharacterized protein LOC141646207 n=1 Tax=Silene latifolia TaxID=37657 RepID=UPI003D77A1AC